MEHPYDDTINLQNVLHVPSVEQVYDDTINLQNVRIIL